MFVSAFLLLGGGIYAYGRYRYSQVPKASVPALKSAPVSGPFNVLVIGSDSRQGLTGAAARAYGSGAQVGGSRADTMLLARIDPRTERIALLSIPYDYFAPIAGSGGSNKISDALNQGPGAMVRTVEEDLHVSVQHYVEINFSGVVRMVDALGGVRIDFPYPSKDLMSGLQVPTAGCHLLGGTQALALVRSRFFQYEVGGTWHYDPTAGFGRIHRQQAFLRAAAQRVRGSLLTDPLRLNTFLGAAVHNVLVDKGLSFSTLVHLGLDFRSMPLSSIRTFTVPTQIVNNYGPYGDVLFPVPGKDAQVLSSWRAAVEAQASSATGTGARRTSPSTSARTPNRSGSSSEIRMPSTAVPSNPGSIVQNRTTPNFDPRPC